MSDRVGALRNLAEGNIFHGRSPNGASMICVVTSVSNTTIYSRRITTQDDHQFDRRTGIELGEVPSRIDCVAPFAPDIYDVFVEMDRKGQVLARMFRSGAEPGLDKYKLTAAEHRALLAIDEHVAANRI